MDKLQKQLLDSYIRKRKISLDSVGDVFTNYELVYLLSNDYRIRTNYHGTELILFLRKYPEMINKLNEYELNDLYRNKYISIMLYDNNKESNNIIVNSLDLNKVTKYDLKFVLYYVPELINKVDINRFDNNEIEWFLMYRPELINNFDLSKLNNLNIYNILNKQPQLKHYF